MDAEALAVAAQLLEALEQRPDDESGDGERLDWWLAEQLELAIDAARLRLPEGVDVEAWPRVLADAPIVAWWTQRAIAELFDVDVRTVQRYEERGLPSFGRGRSKRYPVPHAIVWGSVYSRSSPGGDRRVEWLPIEVAVAKHQLAVAYVIGD